MSSYIALGPITDDTDFHYTTSIFTIFIGQAVKYINQLQFAQSIWYQKLMKSTCVSLERRFYNIFITKYMRLYTIFMDTVNNYIYVV